MGSAQGKLLRPHRAPLGIYGMRAGLPQRTSLLWEKPEDEWASPVDGAPSPSGLSGPGGIRGPPGLTGCPTGARMGIATAGPTQKILNEQQPRATARSSGTGGGANLSLKLLRVVDTMGSIRLPLGPRAHRQTGHRNHNGERWSLERCRRGRGHSFFLAWM
eukprot:7205220-Alexandrium_andersonii.AAC.1